MIRILLNSIFLLILFIFSSYSLFNMNENTKLLFFIASFGPSQLHLLYLQIKSFVIMCESGYYVKVIIHYTCILPNSSFNNFYCFSKRSFIDVKLIQVSSQVKHLLVKEHRKYIMDNFDEIKKFDHIAFFENDIGFSLANLNYYFYTLSLIRKYNIKNAMAGFKRYEVAKCDNGDIWRSCQDFINNVTFYNIKDHMFVRIKVGFSAMWILPFEKIKEFVNEKEFLLIPDNEHNGNEGLKPYYSCNYWEKHYTPLIPLERIDDCFVHHMSNKYIHYFASIQLSELYMQLNICRSKNGLIYYGERKNKVIVVNRNNLSKKCVELITC